VRVNTLIDLALAQTARRPVRYAAVSAVGVSVTQVLLLVFNVGVGLTPAWSNVLAVSIACIPSYVLNRYWVWGKRGRNRVMREVVPFWAMALLGLAFSTLLVHLAAQWNESPVVVNAANLVAFGSLWVFKYLLFDAILFKVAPEAVVDDDEDELVAIDAAAS
jgi:putative flippase GtrA